MLFRSDSQDQTPTDSKSDPSSQSASGLGCRLFVIVQISGESAFLPRQIKVTGVSLQMHPIIENFQFSEWSLTKKHQRQECAPELPGRMGHMSTLRDQCDIPGDPPG